MNFTDFNELMSEASPEALNRSADECDQMAGFLEEKITDLEYDLFQLQYEQKQNKLYAERLRKRSLIVDLRVDSRQAS